LLYKLGLINFFNENKIAYENCFRDIVQGIIKCYKIPIQFLYNFIQFYTILYNFILFYTILYYFNRTSRPKGLYR